MAAKIHLMGKGPRGGDVWVFHCPGCGCAHPYEVPAWTWNGSIEAPTFQPSLLCNQGVPAERCHLFVGGVNGDLPGKIQFMTDCHHSLAGKVVEMVDWDSD